MSLRPAGWAWVQAPSTLLNVATFAPKLKVVSVTGQENRFSRFIGSGCCEAGDSVIEQSGPRVGAGLLEKGIIPCREHLPQPCLITICPSQRRYGNHQPKQRLPSEGLVEGKVKRSSHKQNRSAPASCAGVIKPRELAFEGREMLLAGGC